LEDAFRREVFALLEKEGMINEFVIDNMMHWRHTGFNVYCGKTLWPGNENGLQNLARYIIRASFSSERMTHIPALETQTPTASILFTSPKATHRIVESKFFSIYPSAISHKSCFHRLEFFFGRSADRAFVRGFSVHHVSADLAYMIGFHFFLDHIHDGAFI
jgi:hypothetical protein